MMKIEVVEVVDQEDGGALIKFDMSQEAVLMFAKIGLLQCLTETAEAAKEKHGSEEIENDEETGC